MLVGMLRVPKGLAPWLTARCLFFNPLSSFAAIDGKIAAPISFRFRGLPFSAAIRYPLS
jgi:hypothetical protein